MCVSTQLVFSSFIFSFLKKVIAINKGFNYHPFIIIEVNWSIYGDVNFRPYRP